MSRTIINCPEVPSGEIGKRDPDSKLKIYTLQAITPIVGGGVEAGVSDPITLIRPSSIRGHLRFWWRATRGARFASVKELRQQEGEIWGQPSSPSPVSIHVDVPSWSETRTPKEYYGFGRNGPELYALFSASQNGNILCKEGLSFRLSLSWSEGVQDIELDIESAVWAWVNFGGIGARTRRGCGALFCSSTRPDAPDFHPASVDNVGQWLKKNATRMGIRLLPGNDNRDWPTIPHTIFASESPKDPLTSWRNAVGLMKEFRQGQNYGRDPGRTGSKTPGPSRWPEAESVRVLTEKHRDLTEWPEGRPRSDVAIPAPYFPRAEFGMPIIFELRHKKLPADKLSGRKPEYPKPTLIPTNGRDRMASPVILRPLCFSDKTTASMVAVLNTRTIETVCLKPGEAKNDLTHAEEVMIKDRTLAAYPNSPLGPAKSPRSENGSAVETFLAFAGEKKFRRVY